MPGPAERIPHRWDARRQAIREKNETALMGSFLSDLPTDRLG
ncbi:hypothetical protein FsymDg_4183 [Candidatus Protofrankia datiscae]|uniref:Uncharacterized protein n=1 Tax=Candidatus Protofrankia datiscae TaxID=2716812 RepID=F8AX01_9ACTN|nr:hypothetical protein FsymDg_4183 [Candidatus Protofrankia datiscae]